MNPYQRKHFALMVLTVIIISAVVGFIAGGLGTIIVTTNNKEIAISTEEIDRAFIATLSDNTTNTIDDILTNLVENATPSVVSIIVSKDVPRMKYSPDNPYDIFFGGPFEELPEEFERQKIGGGSGFFISEDGLIVTNRHVVSDPNAQYTVITSNGTKYEATVLARDTITDFAVINIESDMQFPALTLGDSSMIRVGQSAIAIGNSLGEFPNTVSRGIVSGIGRDIVAGSYFGSGEQFYNIIQTDAAINPGNSGGPLLDINGTVIGINTATAQGAQNIGFAIPIDHVSAIIDQVRKNGTITRPFLGVRFIAISPEIADTLDNFNEDHGALLLRGQHETDNAVIPGSSADQAGLLENDVILAVDGVNVDTEHSLQELLLIHTIGDTVNLTLWRTGKIIEISVMLQSGTQEATTRIMPDTRN